MFKSKLFQSSSAQPVSGDLENPYLSARRTWNTHTGSTLAALRLWQAIALLALMLLLVVVGGYINLSRQSTFIPYVFEVDKLGNTVASGPLSPTTTTDPRLLKTTVAAFISDARLVTPDIELQRQAIFRLFSQLTPGDPATQKMKDWLDGDPDSTPFARAKTQMVNIDIQSVIPQTVDTWQVDWQETVRGRSGVVVDRPLHYRALVTVYAAVPSAKTTEKQLRMNPLGIFIRDYSWQKLQ